MNTLISALETHAPESADDPIFWEPSRVLLKPAIVFTVEGCVAFECAPDSR